MGVPNTRTRRRDQRSRRVARARPVDFLTGWSNAHLSFIITRVIEKRYRQRSSNIMPTVFKKCDRQWGG